MTTEERIQAMNKVVRLIDTLSMRTLRFNARKIIEPFTPVLIIDLVRMNATQNFLKPGRKILSDGNTIVTLEISRSGGSLKRYLTEGLVYKILELEEMEAEKKPTINQENEYRNIKP
ncbi:hypothetical protein [Aurantibacillus circumpalustris]|uniref:hypothetical protein n=1 Tax=Aurantibacillus circumpalustris TaxID=3036359 RepID=UPI00295AAC8F|nr:hypothetical protein [Aurantibacillus circumpalustris]